MSTPVSQTRARVPRLAESAVERARLTVVPRRRTRAPKVPFVSLVSLLLVGGVVGLLLFNTNMQQLSFVASSMEARATALSAQEESLRIQLHRLRDPQRVAAEARRLGMVPASSPAFIRLSDGKVLGTPTVAQSADAMRITPPLPAKPLSLRPRLVIAEVPATRPADRRTPRRAARDTGHARAATSPAEGRGSRTKNRERSADTQRAEGGTR